MFDHGEKAGYALSCAIRRACRATGRIFKAVFGGAGLFVVGFIMGMVRK